MKPLSRACNCKHRLRAEEGLLRGTGSVPLECEDGLADKSEIVIVNVVVGRAKSDVVRIFGVEFDTAHVGLAFNCSNSLLEVNVPNFDVVVIGP